MFKDIVDSSSITCYKLAKLSGVSYTAIDEIYRGERFIRDCTVLTAKKIADVFQMTLDELCFKCEERINIPNELYPCFWDTDPTQLTCDKNKTYIITRLLSKGGYAGLVFIKKAFTYEEIRSVAMQTRNLSPKTASFLKNVFHLQESKMAFYAQKITDWRK